MTEHEMLMNYRFRVVVDNSVLSFAKVSGLGMELETEMLGSGGTNGTGYIAAVPAKHPKTLRLEKGLLAGQDQILKRLRPGMYLQQGVVVMLLDAKGIPQVTYAAENAMVTKWEIADMDAQSGQVLINTFEIAYTNLSIV